MIENRPIKMTQNELERLLVRVLGLPRTTTGFTLSCRAGEPAIVQASFVAVPLEVVEDELIRHCITFLADTRMELWWNKTGHKLYRRARNG